MAMATGISYCDRINLSFAMKSISHELNWSTQDNSQVLGAFLWAQLLSQTIGALLGNTLAELLGGKWVVGGAALVWSLLTCTVLILCNRSVSMLIAGKLALGVLEGITLPAAYHLLKQFLSKQDGQLAVAFVLVAGAFVGAIGAHFTCHILIDLLGWERVVYWLGACVGPTFTMCWMYFVPSARKQQLEQAPVDINLEVVEEKEDVGPSWQCAICNQANSTENLFCTKCKDFELPDISTSNGMFENATRVLAKPFLGLHQRTPKFTFSQVPPPLVSFGSGDDDGENVHPNKKHRVFRPLAHKRALQL